MCSFSSAIFLQPGTTWVQWTPTVWPSGSTERSQLCFQTGLRVTWSCGIFTRPLRIRLRSELLCMLHTAIYLFLYVHWQVMFSSAHPKFLDCVWFQQHFNSILFILLFTQQPNLQSTPDTSRPVLVKHRGGLHSQSIFTKCWESVWLQAAVSATEQPLRADGSPAAHSKTLSD